jgi:phosphatidylserine/phosphatidylglycerophosphate/cardiolipin synthase-like enzyme
LYVRVKGSAGVGDEGRVVGDWLSKFVEDQLGLRRRLPRIWCDPATIARKGGVSLHPNCVVSDERWAFVTSANFTEGAQERNIEAA